MDPLVSALLSFGRGLRFITRAIPRRILRKEKELDITTALRIVVERVEVNGDEEVELAIRTVEDALRLTPVISHGHLQPFHYRSKEDS